MKKYPATALLIFSIIFCFYSNLVISQVPGFINRQATNIAGRAVLDPNGDGYSSILTSGFGSNDVINSEVPYKGVRSYSIEPYGDLRRGPNHAYSDFVHDSSGIGFYTYFTAAQQVLFRFRLGSIMPGSKGYSVLMDTDGKFGATGANADPNYIASTTGTNGNPGFEIEIVLETNFRISIYNVDGTSSPVVVKQYTNWQDMSQVSIAATNDNGDPDFYMDFYIPFSDLQAVPFNLTTASPIRMTATTVMKPGAAIGGPRSDIYGVANDDYEDFINGQPACPIFNTVTSCPTAMCTSAALVNSPLSTGTVNISGTWTKSVLNGALGTANITVYKNAIVAGTVNNVVSGTGWTLNNITLINGDIITAKSVATGETMCLTSNAVVASTCNSSNRPASPILGCYSGSKGINGSNYSTGLTIHVDNMTRSVFDNHVNNSTTLFGAISGSNWVFSGGCSTGAPLTSGSYKIYYTDNVTGCVSLPAYFCAAGNGMNALAGSLAVPTISTPSNAVFTTATTSIIGSTDANALVKLYVNGTNTKTTTAAAGGGFTFSSLNLLNGQQLYITVELNTGTVGTSKCANQTGLFTVSCYSQPPLINSDNNNQVTAGLPVTGTSVDPAGTTIRVYNSAGNILLATTTVQVNGSWSTGNAGTLPAVYNAINATSYYANAQNGGCAVSNNSPVVAAAAVTPIGRCGTITGPVAAGVAGISGTLTGSFTTTTVNLYLDGEFIGTTTTNGTGWGPILVNSSANNTLFSNGVLSIGIREGSNQEVACPGSKTTILCTPTPVAPIFTPTNSTITQNQNITYTISNAVAGNFYAIADSATGQSLGIGKWAISNGTLMMTTSSFTDAGTFRVVIKSTSLSGVNICTSVSTAGSAIVNPVVLPLTLLDFTGKKQLSKILLEWVTEDEVLLSHFEIERSIDGNSFNKIGQLSATGYSNGKKSYAFTDTDPQTINYYRLKMIDLDGKYRYSKTIVFSNDRTAVTEINNIMPNPFSDFIKLDLNMQNTEPVIIQMIDVSGRIVYTKNVQVAKGNNVVICNGLSGLAAGIYLINIKTTDAVLQQKALKIKK